MAILISIKLSTVIGDFINGRYKQVKYIVVHELIKGISKINDETL